MSRGDTIAAVASGAAPAGVGIVRVSGPAVPGLAARLLGRPPRPRHAHYLTLRDDAGEPIDQGLLLFFPAPHSFTGEDVMELQVHGSPVVLNTLVHHLVGLGARHARPGEFSERAFLNNKLDLAQAEAVADLITAGSELQARAALRSLQGAFSRRVDDLVEAVTRLRIHVEAAIDFPEEEIDFLADPVIGERLAAVTDQARALLGETRRGARITRGLHAVILGPPNAGKSSLLNALLGDERAIVTEQAGTTRDLLHERLRIDGVEIGLVDTAGLREDSEDAIEREGMRRARQQRAQADLLLLVLPDGDGAAEALLREESAGAARRIWIHNKIDLSGGPAGRRDAADGELHVGLCARSGQGLDTLHRLLRELAGASTEGGAFSARERHVEALAAALAHLEAAADPSLAGAGELMAEELRQAQQRLGEITGAFDADALLGRIFSEFCIGK
ncbi:tRNA uridine-5-carboxymethylaminomethyl(34) synthesis GTPase MnmE [Pseudomarimonas salicorniae]|uniref:tRNA modification GTPase MnmE n=1 Tax=Pseudomarimonas salicorniae TaxID=2933270 RepID=A0ABT0GD45_9GAMM|nr:tRNA uridine-5-carboxymethylaminomethyl(34) synthesis GTPase MnmE [Lysobacter sp. CAU 1642]